MTAKQALKMINSTTKWLELDFNGQGQVVSDETVEELAVAIRVALEKQDSQKVHPHRAAYKGICPRCLSVEDESANYCRVCGQALFFT